MCLSIRECHMGKPWSIMLTLKRGGGSYCSPQSALVCKCSATLCSCTKVLLYQSALIHIMLPHQSTLIFHLSPCGFLVPPMSFVPDLFPPGWLCGSLNLEFSPKTFILLQRLHTMVSNNFGFSLSSVLAFNGLTWFRSYIVLFYHSRSQPSWAWFYRHSPLWL